MCWEETDYTHNKVTRYYRNMTDECIATNADGADAGANEFFIRDEYGDGTYIMVDEQDSRLGLNSVDDSLFSMMQGMDPETAGVLFIGYHARGGSQNAVLAHIWFNRWIADVWLNDTLVGEYSLNITMEEHAQDWNVVLAKPVCRTRTRTRNLMRRPGRKLGPSISLPQA